MNDMKSEESAETGTAGRAGPESGRAVSRSGANRDLEGLVEEARALALYVSRHGDVLPEDRHDLHEELLEAIAKAVDIFNDYIAPPPDLSGGWKFTVVYEDTARDEFEGLQVTYQVLLYQEGLSLSGHGEKLSDRGPTQDAVDYTGDRRTTIGIRGVIERSYFSSDTVRIHYGEAGRRRGSATFHRLAHCGRDALCGCFRSTIADTSGPAWWQRRGGLDRIHEPVKRPDDCGGADCRTAAGQCR